MTDQQAEVPWNELDDGQWAGYNAHPAVAGDHYRHAPARDAAERAEYDQIERDATAAAEAHERDVHFNGEHVQDEPAHGMYCAGSCPYDTAEQARERTGRQARAEAQGAAAWAELEAGQ